MRSAACKLTMTAAISIAANLNVCAQTDASDGRNPYQADQENECTQQAMTTARTYSFRTLRLPAPSLRPGREAPRGWFVNRPGWLSWFTLWTPADPRMLYKVDDIRYMSKVL